MVYFTQNFNGYLSKQQDAHSRIQTTFKHHLSHAISCTENWKSHEHHRYWKMAYYVQLYSTMRIDCTKLNCNLGKVKSDTSFTQEQIFGFLCNTCSHGKLCYEIKRKISERKDMPRKCNQVQHAGVKSTLHVARDDTRQKNIYWKISKKSADAASLSKHLVSPYYIIKLVRIIQKAASLSHQYSSHISSIKSCWNRCNNNIYCDVNAFWQP